MHQFYYQMKIRILKGMKQNKNDSYEYMSKHGLLCLYPFLHVIETPDMRSSRDKSYDHNTKW